jgi:transcriptional regulator
MLGSSKQLSLEKRLPKFSIIEKRSRQYIKGTRVTILIFEYRTGSQSVIKRRGGKISHKGEALY